jgi:hypothetical protein
MEFENIQKVGERHVLSLGRVYCILWGRDSVICIATRYGLDGLGFDPRWKHFSSPTPVKMAVRSTQPALMVITALPG